MELSQISAGGSGSVDNGASVDIMAHSDEDIEYSDDEDRIGCPSDDEEVPRNPDPLQDALGASSDEDSDAEAAPDGSGGASHEAQTPVNPSSTWTPIVATSLAQLHNRPLCGPGSRGGLGSRGGRTGPTGAGRGAGRGEHNQTKKQRDKADPLNNPVYGDDRVRRA